jgi:hypothetical protein
MEPSLADRQERRDSLQRQLDQAENDLTAAIQTKTYTPAELQLQVIQAIADLRAEISGAWQGMAETLGTLAEVHAANIGDHIAEHRKATREAIGQHALKTEAAVHLVAAEIHNGCAAIAKALQEGLILRPL